MVVTNMYPSAARPHWGAFIRSQVESLTALGVENTIYEIEGWKSTARYAHAMREVPVLARRVGADLVHAHYGLSGAAAVSVREIPLVVSFCGDDLLGRPDAQGRITHKSKWLVSVSRLAARRADAVIVKTAEMRRKLPEVAGVEVIPNGVDLERFAPIPRDEARARLDWAPEGASVHRKDYGDATMLPGLVDAHTHLVAPGDGTLGDDIAREDDDSGKTAPRARSLPHCARAFAASSRRGRAR